MLQVLPLEFYQSANGAAPPPRDPLLFEAVQKFCEKEFGERRQFQFDFKTWVVVSHDDSGYVVHGITSLRNMLDLYIFHIAPAGEDKEARDQARNVTFLLHGRASAFIQDQFGKGSRVQVFVAPAVERFWKGFLRMIKAKPSNRWELEV
jgi:hypothetical protein